MPDIKPCLWFGTEAEDAASFYVSVFPNSKINSVMRGAPGSPAVAVDFANAFPERTAGVEAAKAVIAAAADALGLGPPERRSYLELLVGR